MVKRLHLVSNGEVIGHLDQDQGGALRLTAPPGEGVPRLSLAFAPSSTPIAPRLARAYVEGLLPENDQARQATARRFGVSSTSPFALLNAIGHDCPGAVQFLNDQRLENPRSEELALITEKQIGERLRELRTNPAASWIAEGEHWSLGGAQSKFALRRENGAWYEAHGTAATTHIFKPGARELDAHALTEHVCLRTFAHLGLRTANSHFEWFDGEPAIVIERFDRRWEDGALYRVHQEDLCQATSTLPPAKYEVKALDVVTTLRSAGASEADIAAFVQSVVANWLLGAPDGHAKNYSVFLTSQDVALAPLYDIATGLAQSTRYPEVAMGIGGEKRFEKIKGSHLRKFATDLGVDGEKTLNHAVMMALAMPTAFEVAMGEIDIDGPERAHLERAHAALKEYCSRALTAIATGV